MPRKIWMQSMGVLGVLPSYEAAIREQAERVLEPGTEIELHGLDARTFGDVSPIEVLVYPWAFRMASIQVIQNALRSEAEGYDAFLLTSYGDPGLREIRSMVDIPVASLFEFSLIMAGQTALSPALFSLTPDHARLTAQMVEEAGFGERILKVYSMPSPITERELNASAVGDGGWLGDFEAVSREAIADGADMLIPSEGMINTLIAKAGVKDVDGVPVQDSFAAACCYAEMLIKLKQLSGYSVSRRHGLGRAPQAAIESVREVAAEALAAKPGRG